MSSWLFSSVGKIYINTVCAFFFFCRINYTLISVVWRKKYWDISQNIFIYVSQKSHTGLNIMTVIEWWLNFLFLCELSFWIVLKLVVNVSVLQWGPSAAGGAIEQFWSVSEEEELHHTWVSLVELSPHLQTPLTNS